MVTVLYFKVKTGDEDCKENNEQNHLLITITNTDLETLTNLYEGWRGLYGEWLDPKPTDGYCSESTLGLGGLRERANRETEEKKAQEAQEAQEAAKKAKEAAKKAKEAAEEAFETLLEKLKTWAASQPFLDNLIKSSNNITELLLYGPIKVLVLPWHKVFGCEVLFMLNAKNISNQPIINPCDRVKILTILGNRQKKTGGDIEIEPFKTAITDLTNINTDFLDHPTRQKFFNSLLSQNEYHILLFIGHSWTNQKKKEGVLHLDNSEDLGTISIDNFAKTLDLGNRGGLKLCFFSSCDGIGMAEQLAESDISTIIVFRHTVHDNVAKTFLKKFLTAFSSGKNSLFKSVSEGREAIKSLENDFPNASFLPMVFHRGVDEKILIWESLTKTNNIDITPSWAGVCRGMFKQQASYLVTNNPLAKDHNGFGFETIEINSSLTLKEIN